MATLAQLYARREQLLAALGSGAQTVQHGDTAVTYRSVNDIRTALATIENEIANITDSGIVRTYKLTSSKDL